MSPVRSPSQRREAASVWRRGAIRCARKKPGSIRQELVSIVEQLPSLLVQPILHERQEPSGAQAEREIAERVGPAWAKSSRPRSDASWRRGEASMPWRARSGSARGRCSGCERNWRGRLSSAPRRRGLLPETICSAGSARIVSRADIAWTMTTTSTPSFLGSGTKRLLSHRCRPARPICRIDSVNVLAASSVSQA
jgi:hypothetical protein